MQRRTEKEQAVERLRQLANSNCMIDILFKLDDAEKKVNDPQKGNIKSMSSGGRSITFGNNETVYSGAVGDREKQNELMLDAIREYLYDTDLLYAGVD